MRYYLVCLYKNNIKRNSFWKTKSVIFISMIFLFILTKSNAQSDTPLKPAKTQKVSMSLRGKLFGFFIIEDAYFSTATLGTEISISTKHSLGVDYTYFGWQFQKDNAHDTALYDFYERRGYLYLDYKYKFLSLINWDFYLNTYGKIGSYNSWFKGASEGYSYSEKAYLNDKVNGTFNQFGIGVGFKRYFIDDDRWYMDLNLNFGKTYSNNNSVTYDSLFLPKYEYNIRSNKNVFYARLNIGFRLFN